MLQTRYRMVYFDAGESRRARSATNAPAWDRVSFRHGFNYPEISNREDRKKLVIFEESEICSCPSQKFQAGEVIQVSSVISGRQEVGRKENGRICQHCHQTPQGTGGDKKSTAKSPGSARSS
jgi:hypothetical protein